SYTGCGGAGSDNQGSGGNDVGPGYCENGWTFNGGDAGDNNAWSYTGCSGGGGGGSSSQPPADQYTDNSNGGGSSDPNSPSYDPCDGRDWDPNEGRCLNKE